MLEIIPTRNESPAIYATYTDVPIIESDEKVQEIITKLENRFRKEMTRFRILTQFTSMAFGIPHRYFIDTTTKGEA